MCGGGGKSAAPAPTVDPEAERRAAEAEAAKKANEQAVLDARRKRQQKGFLATDSESGDSVLSKASTAKPSTGGSVLSAGG
jgi:hypothetical protein